MASGSRNVSMAVTWISGLMSKTRSRINHAFFWPWVLDNACSCRFRLVGSTTSPSTRVRRPTPDRARNSTAKLPTPPRPTTNTCAACSRERASSPSNKAERSNQGGVAIMGQQVG